MTGYRLLRATVVSVTAGVLLVVVLPRVLRVSWPLIATALRDVPVGDLGLLALVWIGGLLIHTVTLTAALPGLSHRRALTLSLTGSAVANVLPVGGAAGVALNYRMVRSWGHDRTAFAVYTAVTNVWDVAVKLAVPAVVLPLAVRGGTSLPAALVPTLQRVTGVGGAVLVVAIATGAAVALCPPLTARVARAPRLAGVRRVVAASRALVRRRWPRLTLGMLGYTAALAVLFVLCCRVGGLDLPPAALALGFATERLLTLVNLTPGGLGPVEVGLSALLVALGGAPLAVVTAVLLYRLFTVALEVPVGGLGILAWAARRDHVASGVV